MNYLYHHNSFSLLTLHDCNMFLGSFDKLVPTEIIPSKIPDLQARKIEASDLKPQSVSLGNVLRALLDEMRNFATLHIRGAFLLLLVHCQDTSVT